MATARRLVEPTWSSRPAGWVSTLGPAVGQLAAAVGLEPTPEQQLVLDAVFAVRTDGFPAAFEVDLIGPRQIAGKTAAIAMAEIGWLFVTHEPLVLHTAHRQFAINEAHKLLAERIKGYPTLSRWLPATRTKGITREDDNLGIELRTGERLVFQTRTEDTGRSLSPRKVVGDEWYAATAGQAGAIIPTLAAQPDGQLLLASSAGKQQSEALREVRDRGRAGVDPRQAYFEWSDGEPWACEELEDGSECDHRVGAPGCTLDDETRWRRYMRLDGSRSSVETVRGLRGSMPAAEFAREITGRWDDPKRVERLALPGWFDLQLPVEDEDGYEVERPDEGLVLGAAVGLDQEWSSIAAAARWPDKRINVGAVDRRRGTRWLVPELKRIQDEQQAPVVMDEKCPDAGLFERLDQAGVEVTTRNLDEVAAAYSWLVTAVQEHEVTHFADTELDAAVGGAARRRVGDRSVWGLRQSAAEISMLNAATLAGHGVSEGLTLGAFNIY